MALVWVLSGSLSEALGGYLRGGSVVVTGSPLNAAQGGYWAALAGLSARPGGYLRPVGLSARPGGLIFNVTKHT
jgi:hypothetical protein